jgi:hypothetical protein
MGTDIEVHTEVKINGKWQHYGCPYIQRFYVLFAKMSGERIQPEWHILPIDAHKEMPPDATELTLFAHNYVTKTTTAARKICWLDRYQIEELDEWFRKELKAHEHPNSAVKSHGLEAEFDYLFHNGWVNNSLVEDVRFIFWYT